MNMDTSVILDLRSRILSKFPLFLHHNLLNKIQDTFTMPRIKERGRRERRRNKQRKSIEMPPRPSAPQAEQVPWRCPLQWGASLSISSRLPRHPGPAWKRRANKAQAQSYLFRMLFCQRNPSRAGCPDLLLQGSEGNQEAPGAATSWRVLHQFRCPPGPSPALLQGHLCSRDIGAAQTSVLQSCASRAAPGPSDWAQPLSLSRASTFPGVLLFTMATEWLCFGGGRGDFCLLWQYS
ncbi:uncharacterized protein LOC119261001 isoform X2 [Talpa occidentalis]|nr:uncharacterized protein LOC119261001 isoform X2 [Talpa occidentalis]XP_054544207.1 uncharacterized protein LOC119261001 isoform X2 [Talpa occidentalis]XP_054544208.1 uncharacterized protein LOC119261001 isoform X2 [Talpa occidentalis]